MTLTKGEKIRILVDDMRYYQAVIKEALHLKAKTVKRIRNIRGIK
jgi:hypothetical protein